MGFFNFIQSNPFAYTVYSICALLMAALMAYTAAKLFFVGSKRDRLEYLKNYKKGQFLCIYLIAIPLYFTGYAHLAEVSDGAYGMRLFQCLLEAIDSAISLVKLDFGMGSVAAYMRADAFYAAVVTVCFLLTIFNVVLFTASLLWQRATNFFRTLRARHAGEVYLAIGESEANLCLLKSVRDHGKRGILLCTPDPALRDTLYLERIPYAKFPCESVHELAGRLKGLFGRALRQGGIVKKSVILIVNTGDSKRDLLFTQEAYAFLSNPYASPFRYAVDPLLLKGAEEKDGTHVRDAASEYGEASSLKEVPVTAASAFLQVYVYGELSDKAVYSDLVKDSCGHIAFLNRYELAALDFVKQYPLTRFMTNSHIDYGHGTIQEDVELNVCFIGFGPTNKQIFLRMVSDAQLYARAGDGIAHKKVNYHFFDRKPVYMDKTFNRTYNRYTQAFLKEEYAPARFLPLPDYPANDGLFVDGKAVPWQENAHFHCVDINDYRFLEELRAILLAGKNSYNYIIVSFGEDLEDIDFAKQIERHLDLSGVNRTQTAQAAQTAHSSHATYLFAKVRDKRLSEELSRQNGSVIPFGCASDTVYDILKISEDPIRRMAQYKSFSYPRGSNRLNWAQRYRGAIAAWLEENPETRDSNYYACLNLRLKLNLLGYDYAPAESSEEDAGQEFAERYFGSSDPARIEAARHMFEGDYVEAVYRDGSLRTQFAMQEHQRWNAYEISCGYVPMPVEEMKQGRGKDAARLRHGCLTTFEGLIDYRKLLNGERDTLTQNEKRKYDYKPLDIADLLLRDLGYKLIKRP